MTNFEPDYVVYAERADLEPKPLAPSDPSPVGTEADRLKAADRLDRNRRRTLDDLRTADGGFLVKDEADAEVLRDAIRDALPLSPFDRFDPC